MASFVETYKAKQKCDENKRWVMKSREKWWSKGDSQSVPKSLFQ